MNKGTRLGSPALAISLLALFVALGGTVFAAARIDGRRIAVRSLPGNRLRPRSLPGNRLRPHSIPANRLMPGVLEAVLPGGQLTGADINELTLGQVPSAAVAESAESAQRAVEAETALTALEAIDAETVNGHRVGCEPGTGPFAGACWDSSPSLDAATAPEAAASCAARGATLPEALQLAAFAKQSGVVLSPGDEWSGDLTTFSGPNAYAVVTVSSASVLDVALSTAEKHYRCVTPLLQ
jgi:hypothetical protein